jgi:Ca2+-binding RTX toxin-like protein
MRKSKLLLAGVVLALTATSPPAAHATEVLRDGSALVLRGGTGENNYLQVRVDSFNSRNVTFTDATTNYALTADPALGCEITSSGSGKFASCPFAGFDAVRIEGGDATDELDADPRDLPFTSVTLDGGPGNDNIEGPTFDSPVTIRGGDGDDTIKGSQGNDVVDGGAGNDKVDGNDGNDQVHGGEGDDTVTGGRIFSSDLIDGGPGRDTVDNDWNDTNQPGQPLRVTMDGVADDGRPGENDNVLSIETIETHRVATLIAGGDPVEFSVTNTPSGSSTLVGSPGNDRLRASAYNDRVDGGGGADAIAAGAGDDTITGGTGPDTILADGGVICDFLSCSESLQGNDTIEARDGERDSIDCGAGTDTANVDPIDVTSNCENVVGGAPRAGTPPPAAKRKATKRKKACVVPKIKAGTTLATAKRKLTSAGCKVKVRRTTSRKVRKGRVVGLTRKVSGKTRRAAAGKKLGAGTVIYVTVSRGRR